MTLAQILTLLLPELVLAATGLVILGLDLVWHSPSFLPKIGGEEGRGKWLPYLALAGLGGALVATFGVPRRCSLSVGLRPQPSLLLILSPSFSE